MLVFSFLEISRASFELGLHLAYVHGGTGCAAIHKWIGKGLGVSVIARKEGCEDRIIGMYEVLEGGPARVPEGYDGPLPTLKPIGDNPLTRWALMNRTETKVVGA